MAWLPMRVILFCAAVSGGVGAEGGTAPYVEAYAVIRFRLCLSLGSTGWEGLTSVRFGTVDVKRQCKQYGPY